MITDRPLHALVLALSLRLLVLGTTRAYVILDVDWDVVLSIVLGIAGIGYVVIDHRRVTKLDEWGQSLGERVATLEAQIQTQGPHSIPERISELEGKMEAELIKHRIAEIADARIEAMGAPDLTDRLVKLEQLVERRGRDKRGRFAASASNDHGSSCEDPRVAAE